jgi:hypothetical protein
MSQPSVPKFKCLFGSVYNVFSIHHLRCFYCFIQGIYPIALCVLIHQQTSIWDAPEVSQYMFTSICVEDSSYGHGQVGEVTLAMEVVDVDSTRSEAEMELSHHDKATLRGGEVELEDEGERTRTKHRSHGIMITPGSECRFGPASGITAAETNTVSVCQRSGIPSKRIQEPNEAGGFDGGGGVYLEKFV